MTSTRLWGAICRLWVATLTLTLSSVSLDRAFAEAGFARREAAATGLMFTNSIPPARYLTNHILINGSGVAAGDLNGDGKPDLVFAAANGSSAVYLNLGHWQFTNATATTIGTAFAGLDVSGVTSVDLDGDGDLDLIANTFTTGTRILLNDGRGHLTPSVTLNPRRAGESLALADVDGDGDLDLYVANYRPVTMRDEPNGKFTIRQVGGIPQVALYNGRPTTEPDLVGRFYYTPVGVKENGEPHVLFLNDGKGTFTPVSWTDGAFVDADDKPLGAPPYDWGLSVILRDLNGDGRPDLYVCNDFESPDRIWINETATGGPVRFRALPITAIRNTPAFSMGIDAADINHDGIDDLFAVDMLSRDHRERNFQVDALPTSFHEPGRWSDRQQMSRNTLFLGRGDGTYAEIARLAGVAASEWAWTPVFLDVDLDGLEDLLVSNGHEMNMLDADAGARAEAMKSQRTMSVRELLELRRLLGRFAAPNAAFRNQGNLAFADVTREWGLAERTVSNGMAVADLDGDGDLDLIANNLNEAAGLYENRASEPRVAIRLKGRAPNTAGIGARITVLGGPVPKQSQVMISGGRYLSGDEAIRTFAAGHATQLTIEVKWPAGTLTVVSNVAPNQTLVVSEQTAQAAVTPAVNPPQPWFEDVSARLHHSHVETAFDDFTRQPLLTRNLAYAGPGVSWADVNGDGFDDLLVGNSAGNTPGAFLGDGAGGFRPMTNAVLSRPIARDAGALLFQNGAIFAAMSNYRDGTTNGGALRLVMLARDASGEVLSGQALAAGALASADVDGDGTLEVFIGGRALPGRYPEPATSLLVKVVAGRFTVLQKFESLGLVNGAVFTDYDGDKRPDLVIAADWSPLRVFHNEGGRFVEATEAVGLAQTAGWWNSVTTADLDEDGQPDLIAGNWGWNSFPVPRSPLDGVEPCQANRRRIRWGDLDANGSIDLIESYFDASGRELPYRKFDQAAAGLPFLHERYTNRADYGAATLAEIYGEPLAKLPLREASMFGSTAFLNRGGRFEARRLPVEAQFAPAFGLAVADYDGDGHDDVFLAQNFFAVSTDESRQDGGRGQLLRGDGKGGFAAVNVSGADIYGEGRGAAVADFDQDGRPDLVVAQNGLPTRLLRNAMGKPGVRVRLTGGSANPTGIGARLRLFAGDKGGAVHELHQGSGYWSVDSPAVVLTHPEPPTSLEVKWPDGTVQKYSLRPGARQLTVKPDGSADVQ